MRVELPVVSNLAHCFIKQENYKEALKYAQHALELDPHNSKANYRAAISLNKLG